MPAVRPYARWYAWIATGVLAVPAAVLGGLAGFAMTHPDDPTAACARWAREYRDARDDLSTAVRLWRGSPDVGNQRLPEPDDVRARVSEVASARPPHCDLNGRTTR